MFENFKDSQTPVKISWFAKKHLKVREIRAGYNSCIVKTSDTEANTAFYGFSDHESSEPKFGRSTAVFESIICKMEGFDADRVLDYACGRRSTMMILKGIEPGDLSVIPLEPEAQGLIHVYKNDGKW